MMPFPLEKNEKYNSARVGEQKIIDNQFTGIQKDELI